MEVNKFDYNFKLCPTRDLLLTLEAIFKDLEYIGINKKSILNIFDLSDIDFKSDTYTEILYSKVQDKVLKESDRINDLCVQLQQRWEEYKHEYFNIINKVLGITINKEIVTHTYCYLQLLPINQVDLNDNVIYLDANNDIDEIFKQYIILLTKTMLINRWSYVNDWKFNTKFSPKNKIWIFAEIAVDAIFNSRELSKITKEPTYKFFYSLSNDGCNMMQNFRKLYAELPLDKFFNEVYFFVYKNYSKFLKFKQFLY